MSGKDVCHYLKEVRRKIAEENNIPFEMPECTFKGECLGTCPKCESEVRYLEQKLTERKSLAKKVAVVGIAAGLSMIGAPQVTAQTDSTRQFMGDVSSGVTLGAVAVRKLPGGIRSSVEFVESGPTKVVARPFRGNLSTLDYGDYEQAEIPSSPPEFEGGEAALQQFIDDNLQYPEEALQKKIEGAVRLKVYITKQGVIKRVKVIKKLHPLLDAEAERVLSMMPRWFPAMFDGSNVATTREIVVEFKLEK